MEFSPGNLQEVPVQQRFKLPDEDLDPKYKNFMDKAYSDRLGAGTEKKHAQNALDSLEVPQVFVGFVGRFFPLVRWKKGCVFFHERLLLWMMDWILIHW